MLCGGASAGIVAGAGADLGGGTGASGSSRPRGIANLALRAGLLVAARHLPAYPPPEMARPMATVPAEPWVPARCARTLKVEISTRTLWRSLWNGDPMERGCYGKGAGMCGAGSRRAHGRHRGWRRCRRNCGRRCATRGPVKVKIATRTLRSGGRDVRGLFGARARPVLWGWAAELAAPWTERAALATPRAAIGGGRLAKRQALAARRAGRITKCDKDPRARLPGGSLERWAAGPRGGWEREAPGRQRARCWRGRGAAGGWSDAGGRARRRTDPGSAKSRNDPVGRCPVPGLGVRGVSYWGLDPLGGAATDCWTSGGGRGAAGRRTRDRLKSRNDPVGRGPVPGLGVRGVSYWGLDPLGGAVTDGWTSEVGRGAAGGGPGIGKIAQRPCGTLPGAGIGGRGVSYWGLDPLGGAVTDGWTSEVGRGAVGADPGSAKSRNDPVGRGVLPGLGVRDVSYPGAWPVGGRGHDGRIDRKEKRLEARPAMTTSIAECVPALAKSENGDKHPMERGPYGRRGPYGNGGRWRDGNWRGWCGRLDPHPRRFASRPLPHAGEV